MDDSLKKHCIQSLFYAIQQTARVCHAGVENFFAQHAQCRISLDEFLILDTVSCYPNVCQRDLAKLILKGRSHTSKLLAALEEKGIIKRPVDTKGKRMIRRIVLTEDGKDIYNHLSQIALKASQDIEDIIGESDVLKCIGLLSKIKKTVIQTSNLSFE